MHMFDIPCIHFTVHLCGIISPRHAFVSSCITQMGEAAQRN